MFLPASPLSAPGVLGLPDICSGIACLAFQEGPARLGGHGLWLTLRTDFVIMGYTLSDGFGGQRGGDSVGYACWIFGLNIFALHLYVLKRHGPDYLLYLRRRSPPEAARGNRGVS